VEGKEGFMKKVLLIGDSIRMGYNDVVCRMLEGRAEVWGPEENCCFAKYTLWYINEWIEAFGKPDIIHWNNGIWDITVPVGETEVFTPIDEYVNYMKRVYAEMKKTGAVIIFATTTPVKPECPQQSTDRIDRYNKRILEELSCEDILINDLYSFVLANLDEYIGEDFLHMSEYGQEKTGEQVAGFISNLL